MLNLLWFLLPVAAAAGWFAARHGSQSSSADAFWDHASNYHRGLNYLLNEPKDKAVELFANMDDVDRETAETHLALGNMFRRRGEMERAIRVHESLLEKKELGDDIRSEALLELARDYDSAGLLDRSEVLFRKMIDQGERVDQACASLLSIYERERDWSRAIEIATEYGNQIEAPLAPKIAHYHCERAELAIRDDNVELAKENLSAALQQDPDCARANVLWGEIALNEQDYISAVERFATVESQQPELMPEIISPLFDALAAVDNESALRAYIDRIRGRNNAYSVIKVTRNMIAKLDGAAEAETFFKDQIVKRPSLKGLRDWARGQVAKSPESEREKVEAMCDMLDQVVRDKPGYQCSNCGFRGQTLHWRCPGCGHWDTVNTIIGAEGE